MLRVCKFAWLGLALGLSLWGCAAAAAGGSGGKEKPDYPIGRRTDERLRAASALAQKQQWDKALAELEEGDQSKLNPYEKAKTLQLKAQIHLSSDKIDEGLKDLEQAVALDAMPDTEQLQTQYVLGQTYFALQRFPESADTFAKWLERAKAPTAENYFHAASAYAQAKRFQEALPHAKKAVEGSEKPEENRLQLLVWIQFELQQDKEVAEVLQQLIKSFPKKEYWLQLSATYLALNETQKALETLEIPYNKGLLTEDKDLISLARLYLKAGEPLKGATLLQKQMDKGKVPKTAQNMELLANGWILSGDTERGTAALEVVGKQVSSGQVYFELARVHFGKQAWEPARDALARAVTTGGLKSPGDAQLLLGVTHYKMSRKDAALASLEQAKKHPQSAKCAGEWIKTAKKNRKDAGQDCAIAALATKSDSAQKSAKVN